MKDFKQSSFLFGGNAVFIEELYQQYLLDKDSVDETWQNYFQNIKDNSDQKQVNKTAAKIIIKSDKVISNNIIESSRTADSLKAKEMIAAYRKYGHYLVKLDPLGLEINKTKNDLEMNIENFGFNEDQEDNIIDINDESLGVKSCSVNQLVQLLDLVYTKSIAIEFDHIVNKAERSWLFQQIENQDDISLLKDKKKILQDLVEVEGFEQYLHIKFPGAKRFSVEGGDATVVAIDKAIDIAIDYGIEDAVIGMAHRGRLSTLAKVMSKPYKAIMSGFMIGSSFPDDLGISGDVKYHIGYSSDRVKDKSSIHLSMAFNPSHLEAVNPVVAGKVRAKQDQVKDLKRKKAVGILVHGDSAFCGQGVVAESLSMSELKAYHVGGIIHFVINNQVGFTANSMDTRVSRYSTEFAKIINIPIMHVNGDDIELVLKATNIAMNYRQKFSKDVVVEIICYRKYGHNEGDEPMYTQAPMYNIIKNKPTPATIYADKLLSNSVIEQNYLATLKEQFKAKLDKEYDQAKNYQSGPQYLEKLWAGYKRFSSSVAITGVDKNILKDLGIKLCQIPKDFSLNSKLVKLFKEREDSLKQNKAVDWATAEQLAFASLLNSGINIRFTGQDSGRGTFSHRHSVLHSQVDNSSYTPLNNISEGQGYFEIADSNLSEYAVLGFEFGYSLVDPKNLVIWEAQFGDFSNGAQIIFDQFISACEDKWLRMSGVVVLLPHAYEGQGSEHSSARLERFLQLAAINNIQVAYPTTPASLFHLLRRQICSDSRKPLIVMSPKSLLRHKMVTSSFAELDKNTSFIPVLDEIDNKIDVKQVTRVILCSGKVYYDLLDMRLEKNISNIVIIRLEQLYPFEQDFITKILSKYSEVEEFFWCQEEPKNMGAWGFVQDRLNDCLKATSINGRFKYVGRKESASPATGSPYVHSKEQKKLLEEAII
ncbi:MAG: 2-oxoglutarate dehydrogenase E1 component [Rickettsia endosymbiont of Bryobia graminum]|nr:2-oxoglutarate dehydrogenase E1 component [Rickettsia endosymbiont of Bryobia graminum]